MSHEGELHSPFEGAKRGNRQALEALLGACRPCLEASIAARIPASLRKRLDTQDVVQETFLRVVECLPDLEWRSEWAFLAWLQRTAENFIVSETRKQAVRERDDPPPRPSRSAVPPSKALRREERMDRLEAALDSLRPDDRQVLVLARIEGLSVREIAQRMDRTEAATMKLLSRAVSRLREAFGEETESLGLPPRALGLTERKAGGDPGKRDHGKA